jgi:hypothetical protein
MVKVQRAFHPSYPEEAKAILGAEKSLGINKKTGILFLLDTTFRNLTKKNPKLNSL